MKQVGRTFWLRRNTLSGSYSSLRATSRAYAAGSYASRTRSCPSFERKFTYAPPVSDGVSAAYAACAQSTASS